MVGCVYLGDDGVLALKELHEVKTVDLSGCILVTTSAVQILCNHFSERQSKTVVVLVIGGTLCRPHQLRAKKGVELNFSYHSKRQKRNRLLCEAVFRSVVTTSSVQTLCNHFSESHWKSVVKLVIGGTLCRPHQLRAKKGVELDFSDHSTTTAKEESSFMGNRPPFRGSADDPGQYSDDELHLLSAQRSYIGDALTCREETPSIEKNERDVLEWAKREASELGLVLPSGSSAAGNNNDDDDL